ncbi:hypothetical protein ACLOJK_009947 [Asimina triloba]
MRLTLTGSVLKKVVAQLPVQKPLAGRSDLTKGEGYFRHYAAIIRDSSRGALDKERASLFPPSSSLSFSLQTFRPSPTPASDSGQSPAISRHRSRTIGPKDTPKSPAYVSRRSLLGFRRVSDQSSDLSNRASLQILLRLLLPEGEIENIIRPSVSGIRVSSFLGFFFPFSLTIGICNLIAMPRSSRHKRQHKHSSRDLKERSDSEGEEISKERKSREDPEIRVSRDSDLGGKRKSPSQPRLGKDPSSGDYGSSKRRKDRAGSPVVADRWNGGGNERDENSLGEKAGDGEDFGGESERAQKSKASADSKSRSSSRRHDSVSEKKEEAFVVECDSKRRSEKDSGRKEAYQGKEVKDRGGERERKAEDGRRERERSVDAVGETADGDSEVSRRRDKKMGGLEEERTMKKEVEITGKCREHKHQLTASVSSDNDCETLGDIKIIGISEAAWKHVLVRIKFRLASNIACAEKKERMTFQISSFAVTVLYPEWQIQDELRNPELEKELEKRIRRRRDGSDEREKRPEDVRDGDDTKFSSRDDLIKIGRYKDDRQKDARNNEYKDDRHKDGRCSEYKDERHKDGRCSEYKDERHKDGRYGDKYREDLDRDHRYRDDKHRDEHSRDRTSKKSGSKHFREENKPSDSRHKKVRPQDSDRDVSPYADDQSFRNKDSRGRKRSSDDNEDQNDVKSHSMKEHHIEAEKNSLRSSRPDPLSARGRSEPHHPLDFTDSASNRRGSPSPSARNVRDHYSHGPKEVDSVYRDSFSEERRQNRASSRELSSVIGEAERFSGPRSVEKAKEKSNNHVVELPAKRVNSSLSEVSQNSDHEATPIRLTEKSPSSTSGDRRYSSIHGSRRSLDVEEMGRKTGNLRDVEDIGRKSSISMDADETGQKSFSSKDARENSVVDDRVRELHLDKPTMDDFSSDLLNRERTPVRSSSLNRPGQPPGNSASLLPPPPPFRLGVDSPSVLGSSEEEMRGQPTDRKSGSRYKRTGDPNMARGPGNTWKGVANWPSSVTNGFIPFQHGPPPSPFHPMVQQFPAASLFGVRPSMELGHAAYHMHDTGGHARPFGWQNPVENHMHGWDGTNGVFGDESNIYGRPDWDQNRHLIGNRGWEMGADPWKGQNGAMNMDISANQKDQDNSISIPADDTWTGQSSQLTRNEKNHSDRLPGTPAEGLGVKRSDGTPAAKDTTEILQEFVHKKTAEPSKLSTDNSTPFYQFYLSKLDISMDLAHPDCLSLLKIGRETSEEVNSAKYARFEDDTKMGAKNHNYNLRDSLFPAITESVFQRSMELYKRQTAERKLNIITSSPEQKLEEVLPVSDDKNTESMEEKTEAGEERSLVEDTSPVVGSPANEQDRNGESDSECRHSVDADKQESESVSNAIILGDGSEACEALMPESSRLWQQNMTLLLASPIFSLSYRLLLGWPLAGLGWEEERE